MATTIFSAKLDILYNKTYWVLMRIKIKWTSASLKLRVRSTISKVTNNFFKLKNTKAHANDITSAIAPMAHSCTDSIDLVGQMQSFTKTGVARF